MFKAKDRVFVVAAGKVQAGTIESVEYYGTFLETAMVELDTGVLWKTQRHDNIIPFPTVGMGATAGYGGDCYPYTIVGVSKSGRQIQVQRDEPNYIGPPRQYGDNGRPEDWEYTPIPDSHKYMVKLNSKGYWKGVGGHCSIGHRAYRQDPSF